MKEQSIKGKLLVEINTLFDSVDNTMKEDLEALGYKVYKIKLLSRRNDLKIFIIDLETFLTYDKHNNEHTLRHLVDEDLTELGYDVSQCEVY